MLHYGYDKKEKTSSAFGSCCLCQSVKAHKARLNGFRSSRGCRLSRSFSGRVQLRCRLRWRSPEQTRASCYFANVTNTLDACKRNAVRHFRKQRTDSDKHIWNSFIASWQRKGSVKQGPSNYRAYCRDSTRLGRSGFTGTERQAQPFSRPGRADGRLCSEMNRATSMDIFPSRINAEIAVLRIGLRHLCEEMVTD